MKPPAKSEQRSIIAPQPTPAPKNEVAPPEVVSLALGRTASCLYCVAALTTQGLKVKSAEVLDASRDAWRMEEAWEYRAYRLLYYGEKQTPATSGQLFASGRSVAVQKLHTSKRAAVALDVEGNTVTGQQVVFEGGKLDTWNEARDWAVRNLLVESHAQTRRRASQ